MEVKSNPILSARDLDLYYGPTQALKKINLQMTKGAGIALIGPNGSGKSTILKSITRQLRLVGGKVFFDETSLMNISYKELSMWFYFSVSRFGKTSKSVL